MELQVITGRNKRNRLTVTMDRITIKLRPDFPADRVEYAKRFALMVAQRVRCIFRRSMRGSFSKDLKTIEMMNTNRSVYNLYCIDELEPEGLSEDTIRSSDMSESGVKSPSSAFGYGGYGGYGGGRNYGNGSHHMGSHGVTNSPNPSRYGHAPVSEPEPTSTQVMDDDDWYWDGTAFRYIGEDVRFGTDDFVD